MNKKQKAVFLIGATVIVLMGLFPPWYYQVVSLNEHHASFTARGTGDYGFIFNPPLESKYDGLKDEHDLIDDIYDYPVPVIDFARLFVQWIIVITAAGTLIYFLKETKK